MLVPSRGRPGNIAALDTAWLATATGAADLLVIADDDDPALPHYRQVCQERGITLEVGPRLRLGPTLNRAAARHLHGYDAIGFMGDDHRPRTPGWDKAFVTELQRLGTGMVYGNDLLRSQDLPTAVAMTSDMVRALGWMVPPGLVHLFIDNAWLALGRTLGAITYLPDVVIEHMHPAAGKADTDDGYIECNSGPQVEADRTAYLAWHDNALAVDAGRVREATGLDHAGEA